MFFAKFLWADPLPPPPPPQSNPFNVLVVVSGNRTPEHLTNKRVLTFVEAQEWVRIRFGDAEDVDYVFRLLKPHVAFWYRMGERNGETGVLMGYDTKTGLFMPLDDSSPIELQPLCNKRPRSPSPQKDNNIVENNSNTSPPPPPPSSPEPLPTKTKRTTRKRVTLDL